MPPRRPAKRSSRAGRRPVAAAVQADPRRGGLQARSQRGRIGDTWWSQRFITVLESIGVGSRLQRGKRYARTGQVLSMDDRPRSGDGVGAGIAGEALPGVHRDTSVLTAAEWDAAEAVMASSAVFMAKLLAGDMPEEIEEAFAESSGTLFPASADGFESACSCPDWENPCKHIAAVYFLLAEAFDGDPFLIFAWRGRDKDELLAGLRARRRGPGSAHEAGRSDPTEDTEFPKAAGSGGPWQTPIGPPRRKRQSPAWPWGREEDLATIEIRPRLAVAPDLVLRQLDPSPLADDGTRIIEALRPLYEAITGGAAALVLDEPAPVLLPRRSGPPR